LIHSWSTNTFYAGAQKEENGIIIKEGDLTMHPLVTQLHFTRAEFARCFEGIDPEETRRRVEPMNSLSWIVGHLATQEYGFWVVMAQGRNIAPELFDRFGTGQPASIPPWQETWNLWHSITKEADVFLTALRPEDLARQLSWNGRTLPDNVGKMLLRNIYHYWFHLGKAHSVRQMLGHGGLPLYVGDMSSVCYMVEE
jgi:hypothetical protein